MTQHRTLKVCYIDGSLRDNTGHFGNVCRSLTGAMRDRGFEVDVYSHKNLPDTIARELGATPHVRHYPFEQLLANRQLNYKLASASFLCDLRRIWHRQMYDLIWINSVFAPQFAAAVTWLNEFGSRPAPQVAIEFGLSHHNDSLFTEAATNLSTLQRKPLLLTFDATCAADYSRLLGHRVVSLPSLFTGIGTVRERKPDADGLVTVGFLGYQRTEKGYAFLPAIIDYLQNRSVPAKFLIHNSNPTETELDRQMRRIAQDNPRIVFEFKTGGQDYWQQLLDRTDLMVLPYDPTIYALLPSGVAMEAISQGIPVIVPTGTTLEKLVDEYLSGRGKFDEWQWETIAAAIENCISNFDNLAKATELAAHKWRQDNNPDRAVISLLEHTHLTGPLVTAQSKISNWSDGIEDLTVAGLVASSKALRPIWLEAKKLCGK